MEPFRQAAIAAMIGILAFVLVIFSGPLESAPLFRAGAFLIGIGAGAYAHSLLVAVMRFADKVESGLALGAWGAVQATAAGIGVALGGAMRDGLGWLGAHGYLGPASTCPTPHTLLSITLKSHSSLQA